MSVPKKLQVDDSGFNQQKSSPNPRVVGISHQRHKQETTVYFLSHLLAVKAIDHWLEYEKYPIDAQFALKSLGLRKKTDSSSQSLKELELINFLQQTDSSKIGCLSNELEIRVNNLYKKYPFDPDCDSSLIGLFEEVENYLEQWYTSYSLWGGYLTIGTNLLSLRKELGNKFDELSSFWKKASLQCSLDFFEELNSFLLSFEQEYQESREKCLDKENGFLRTYKNHLSAIKHKEHRDDLDKLHKSFTLAQKSLLNLYKFKIKTEAYSLAIQLLKNLIDSTQTYIYVISECYQFLTEIRANVLVMTDLEEENNLFLSLVAGRILSLVNMDDLRLKVEKKLGRSLPNWKNYGGITKNDVQNAILEEAKPIAKKACSSIYQQLKREADSFE